MKPIITNVDAVTNEETSREMTNEEFEIYLSEQKSLEAGQTKKILERQALLEKLGISENEAALLLP
jgi:hypothetical protein